MLFFIQQEHDPARCPLPQGIHPRELIDAGADVAVRFAVVDASRHRMYFLIEADELEAIQEFLRPGIGRTRSEISPVTELSDVQMPDVSAP